MPTISRIFTLLAALAAALSVASGADLGAFTDHGDVGTVTRPGIATYDTGSRTYSVGASGGNMWFVKDAMQFVWRKASGDLSIAAAIGFVGTSTQGHRKACLMIRQNLTPGSPYVDVAQHGDGLTSLQFRETQDGPTKEIQSNVAGPARVRLDKIGDTIFLSVAKVGEQPRPSGASFNVRLTGDFYVGLAVCAHDDNAFETAVFSGVALGPADAAAAVPQPQLKIITLPSGDRRVSER